MTDLDIAIDKTLMKLECFKHNGDWASYFELLHVYEALLTAKPQEYFRSPRRIEEGSVTLRASTTEALFSC